MSQAVPRRSSWRSLLLLSVCALLTLVGVLADASSSTSASLVSADISSHFAEVFTSAAGTSTVSAFSSSGDVSSSAEEAMGHDSSSNSHGATPASSSSSYSSSSSEAPPASSSESDSVSSGGSTTSDSDSSLSSSAFSLSSSSSSSGSSSSYDSSSSMSFSGTDASSSSSSAGDSSSASGLSSSSSSWASRLSSDDMSSSSSASSGSSSGSIENETRSLASSSSGDSGDSSGDANPVYGTVLLTLVYDQRTVSTLDLMSYVREVLSTEYRYNGSVLRLRNDMDARETFWCVADCTTGTSGGDGGQQLRSRAAAAAASDVANTAITKPADFDSAGSYYRAFLSCADGDVDAVAAFRSAVSSGAYSPKLLVASWWSEDAPAANRAWLAGIVIAAVASVAAFVSVLVRFLPRGRKEKDARKQEEAYQSLNSYFDLEMQYMNDNPANNNNNNVGDGGWLNRPAREEFEAMEEEGKDQDGWKAKHQQAISPPRVRGAQRPQRRHRVSQDDLPIDDDLL